MHLLPAASLRNLLLDVTPASQLNAGNAWHGRMTHAGNIIGFGFGEETPILKAILFKLGETGFLPLAKLPFFRLLGGTQFRKFCILCIIILVITVWTTCALHEEQEREKKSSSQGSVTYVETSAGPLRLNGFCRKFREIWNNIKVAVLNLPKPIRRVCYVQFFAFMGWYVA